MNSESQQIGIVFAFSDQSSSFANGFELGMIWQEIDGEGRLIIDRGFYDGFPVRQENIEPLRRMCAARHYRLETRPSVDGWIAARLAYTGGIKPALALVSS